MATKKRNYNPNFKIPYDANGNQMEYGCSYYKKSERDNHTFSGPLRYNHYERGRSACHFYFEKLDATRVVFFLHEFEKLIPHMRNGVVAGTFTFIKRGENFSCRIIKDDDGNEIPQD